MKPARAGGANRLGKASSISADDSSNTKIAHEHQDTERALAKLAARRRKFLAETSGRKIWCLARLAWKDSRDDGRNIHDLARRLLAEAPGQWPDGVALNDVLETYRGRVLSQYGIAGELVKRRVVESPSRGLNAKRWTRLAALNAPRSGRVLPKSAQFAARRYLPTLKAPDQGSGP